MPEIAVRDTILHYEDVGGGEPLLLLHGGLGTAMLHWWREIPVFAEQFRVIAPDLRGYGRSSPPRDFPLDFYQRDAADMAALLTALHAGPAYVVGWSDGAVVSLVLSVEHPRLVRRLVCVSGEARLLPEERQAWSDLTNRDIWGERARQRFIDAQGPLNWPGIFDRMLTGYHALLDQRGGEVTSRRLHNIQCPTLFIHGDADPTVPVSHAYEMHAAVAGSQLRIYPGVGHLPHRACEADFRRDVIGFLTDENDAP